MLGTIIYIKNYNNHQSNVTATDDNDKSSASK